MTSPRLLITWKNDSAKEEEIEMRKLLACMALLLLATLVQAHDEHQGEGVNKVTLENLLKMQLQGAEGTEVIVSRVSLPPHTSLPKHWHPGEEFAYVLEGSVTLWQQGKEDTLIHAGEARAVPLKQVHTAITGDEAVKLVVFRVHESGQPERVPVQ